jgi:hypothetical protein
MRDFRYETVFEGSESEGIGRRRSRHAEEGSRAGLRCLGADHKALPEATSPDRRRRAQAGTAGPPARKREALEERLPAQVRLNPDLTLAEHCELFEEESGIEISTATMSRSLKRLGLPLKKSPFLLPSETKRRGLAGEKRLGR